MPYYGPIVLGFGLKNRGFRRLSHLLGRGFDVAKKTAGKKATTGKKSASRRAAASPKSAKTLTKHRAAKKGSAQKSAKPAAKAAKPTPATRPAKSSRFNGTIAVSGKKSTSKSSTKKTPGSATTATPAQKNMGKSQNDQVIATDKKGAKQPGGRTKKTRTVAEAASTIAADAKGYVFINGRRIRMISTKGQVAKKPKTNGAAVVRNEQADEIAVKGIKTKLSKKELNDYRDLLLEKRRELVGDLSAMENEALRSGGGNLSHMPIHMADMGTDTFDQDFMLGLAANERDQLREIDSALQRIEERTYGVCQMTGEPIPKARLDAKPWAKHTIEAARQFERQSAR